jgi:hypothetical protein
LPGFLFGTKSKSTGYQPREMWINSRFKNGVNAGAAMPFF